MGKIGQGGQDTGTETKEEPAMRKSENRVSQAEETLNLMVLRQDPAWCAQG